MNTKQINYTNISFTIFKCHVVQSDNLRLLKGCISAVVENVLEAYEDR